MIYIIAFVFIIICIASLSGNSGSRVIHHDSRPGSYYEISQRKD